MPAKKRPRKIYLGRMDYCKNEYQRQKLYKQLCGEVAISFMYERIENVKSLIEIESMSFEKAQEYIEKVRSLHSVSKLRKHWGISQNEIYKKFFAKYQITMKPKAGGRPPRVSNVNVVQETLTVESVKQNEVAVTEEKKNIVPQQLITQNVNRSKFNIALEGVYRGDSIGKRLSNITSILDDQTTYNIKLSISENDNESLFTINAGGNFTGALIQKRLINIKNIIMEDSNYLIQYIVEEVEHQVVDLTLQEIASSME